MLDLLVTIVSVWLLFQVMGLVFRVAWGTAKIIASVLCVIAVPLLVVCVLFAGGVVMLLPVALIAIAFGILKKCV